MRCNQQPAVDLSGICGDCHWAFLSDVENVRDGFNRRLRNEVLFQEWLTVNGRL